MANILVTGGAGFIGSNLAARLLNEGHQVVLYDNLSRRGAAHNVAWLQAVAGSGQLRREVHGVGRRGGCECVGDDSSQGIRWWATDGGRGGEPAWTR